MDKNKRLGITESLNEAVKGVVGTLDESTKTIKEGYNKVLNYKNGVTVHKSTDTGNIKLVHPDHGSITYKWMPNRWRYKNPRSKEELHSHTLTSLTNLWADGKEAGKKVHEEVETIDELTYGLLKRYRDAGSKTERGDRLALNKMRKANGAKHFLDPKEGGYLTPKGPKVAATNPPKKPKKTVVRTSIYDEFEPDESETINEISREKAKDYVKAALKSRNKHYDALY